MTAIERKIVDAKLAGSVRDAAFSPAILLLLVATVIYQAVLCIVHTHVKPVSTTIVAASEAVIYLSCACMLIRRIRVAPLVLLLLGFSYLLLLALVRNELDLKSFRDVLIPILFVWIGSAYGSIALGDQVLKCVVSIVLLAGLLELGSLDLYSSIFNIYSYYVSQGNVVPGTHWMDGSTLALNGSRSDAIGRSLFPALLGPHRVSSVFLEPVTMGNFAVIVAAWGLARPAARWRLSLLFVAAALLLAVLADSRYGSVAILMLLLMRAVVPLRSTVLAMTLPVACIVLLVLIALQLGRIDSDTLIGRLSWSGDVLMDITPAMLFGVEGLSMRFHDMGYAVVLTRLGAPMFLALWACLWLIPMENETGQRFRAYASLYVALILCISGTSVFALKSAALLWFLVGCAAARPASSSGANNLTQFHTALRS